MGVDARAPRGPASRSGQRSRPKRGCGVCDRVRDVALAAPAGSGSRRSGSCRPRAPHPSMVRAATMPARARTRGGASPGVPRGDARDQSSASRAPAARSAQGRARTTESRRAASSPSDALDRELGRVLAAAFLAGEWERSAMAARARRALGPPRVAAARRARRCWRPITRPPPTGRASSPPTSSASARADVAPRRRACCASRSSTPQMVRAPLAGAADRHRRRPGRAPRARPGAARVARRRPRARAPRRDERLRHYRYLQLPRAGGPPRVIERPKLRLKEIQRRILHEILDLDPAARRRARLRPRPLGAHPRRAARRPARGRPARPRGLLRGASPPARVYGIFRTAGYPEAVAHALTGLCTNVVPARSRSPAHYRLSRRLATPHLPQGAPTSPALANLAAFRLDRRLTGAGRRDRRHLHALRRRPRRSPATDLPARRPRR